MAFTGHTTGFSASTLTFMLVAVSVSAAISLYKWRQKWKGSESRVGELENSLCSALEKCTAERQGRIRAQQALRKALAQPKSDTLENTFYPLRPIGIVQSCFPTRNGTPRQPLVVSLARACLIFDPAFVPPASLEGLGAYSHCWIIYVFHLNTDLEKLWREPSKSKFKAKVRVPRLKGGRMGVFATRSPHRPCPIGLTVAKLEAIQGHMVLLSGVDLVDGTPVLDIKPYLPYCDSIEGAVVPNWVKDDRILAVASVGFSDSFSYSLADCWKRIEKKSLYASPNEFRSLIEQVLSWDIRSLSQCSRPHKTLANIASSNMNILDERTSDLDEHPDEESTVQIEDLVRPSQNVMYHLVLDGVDVSYRIDSDSNVIVEKASLSSDLPNGRSKHRCSYSTWRGKLS